MNVFRIATGGALALALAACGSSSKTTPPTPGFPQPAGTVAVNFSVDDSVNKDWKAGELEWKGQVQFNPTTRIGTYNSDWNAQSPGWALLYDDGPWDQDPPGHEPSGSTAGDHKWGVTAFIAPPATGTQDFGYGLRDATNPDRVNGGWVWIGNAGSFSIAAGRATPLTAPGMTFPTHGTIDMKLVIDKNAITVTSPPFDTSTITVKGSAWGWGDKTVYDDGTHGDDTAADGKYTFVLSLGINRTVPPYPGLLLAGDRPEFVYTLGGVEYKVAGDASVDGVTAFIMAPAGAWTSTPVIQVTGGLGGKNTAIQVPTPFP